MNDTQPTKWSSLSALLILGGLLGTLSWGMTARWLRAETHELDEFQLDSSQFAVTPVPAWIKTDIPAQVLSGLGIANRTVSLADPDLVRRLAAGFTNSPWVSDVRVVKGYKSLAINLTYRKPVLCVPWARDGINAGCYVDATGTVLPVDEANPESFRDCFVVEGVEQTTLLGVGATIDDNRIAGAARLASILQKDKARLALLVIIVTSAKDDEFRCLIKTRGGSRIHWGGLDQHQQKLGRLLEQSRDGGTLDRDDGPIDWDLTRFDSTPRQL